jgi:hypothetical protein
LKKLARRMKIMIKLNYAYKVGALTYHIFYPNLPRTMCGKRIIVYMVTNNKPKNKILCNGCKLNIEKADPYKELYTY